MLLMLTPLLFSTPTRTSSEFSYGVASGTVMLTVPLTAIVINTLQPVPFGSGGWVKGVAPLAAGQTVPAQLAMLPSANMAKMRVSFFISLHLQGDRSNPKTGATEYNGKVSLSSPYYASFRTL